MSNVEISISAEISVSAKISARFANILDEAQNFSIAIVRHNKETFNNTLLASTVIVQKLTRGLRLQVDKYHEFHNYLDSIIILEK